MTGVLDGPTRAAAVYKSWLDEPDLDPWQPTHAVRSGDTVALCGVEPGAQGGAWPEFVTAWDSSTSRCLVCAQHVYGEADRY